MSENKHTNVHTALAAAQSEMGPLIKGETNPHFRSKYADLASVVDACRSPFAGNGLCFHHETVAADGQWLLRTVLTHGESGTAIWCDVPLIVQKNDMQGFKSATTYAKRIGLESVSGLAPEDDDGNAAAKAAPKEPHAATNGLRDAWRDSVLDSLPENATERDKAAAFSEAIMSEFQSKKSASGVNAAWEKRKDIIAALEKRHSDLFMSVHDCFHSCVAAFDEGEAA